MKRIALLVLIVTSIIFLDINYCISDVAPPYRKDRPLCEPPCCITFNKGFNLYYCKEKIPICHITCVMCCSGFIEDVFVKENRRCGTFTCQIEGTVCYKITLPFGVSTCTGYPFNEVDDCINSCSAAICGNINIYGCIPAGFSWYDCSMYGTVNGMCP